MFKLSTMAAFVTSMLITIFLTITSYLGIYLCTILHKEMHLTIKDVFYAPE